MKARPPNTSDTIRQTFSYDIFSARTGNIYTTAILLQWVEWALGISQPPDEYWEKDGRFFDPFRPTIEPKGFASVSELLDSRNTTIAAFKRCCLETEYFVFTLGLTEGWINVRDNYQYPMCPGTAAGEFNPDQHRFINYRVTEIRDALNKAMTLIRNGNPSVKFILTVSPVPLTATMSGNHVAVATMASKSVLRAVTTEVSECDSVDYFPSYEIINSPVFKGMFFEPNQRNVTKTGVSFVMSHFFGAMRSSNDHTDVSAKASHSGNREPFGQAPISNAESDAICDEELLENFGDRI